MVRQRAYKLGHLNKGWPGLKFQEEIGQGSELARLWGEAGGAFASHDIKTQGDNWLGQWLAANTGGNLGHGAVDRLLDQGHTYASIYQGIPGAIGPQGLRYIGGAPGQEGRAGAGAIGKRFRDEFADQSKTGNWLTAYQGPSGQFGETMYQEARDAGKSATDIYNAFRASGLKKGPALAKHGNILDQDYLAEQKHEATSGLTPEVTHVETDTFAPPEPLTPGSSQAYGVGAGAQAKGLKIGKKTGKSGKRGTGKTWGRDSTFFKNSLNL